LIYSSTPSTNKDLLSFQSKDGPGAEELELAGGIPELELELELVIMLVLEELLDILEDDTPEELELDGGKAHGA